ncbi:hypothetical protein [Maribacter sp. IgM3_T14_3]|uniref:hypothetical protein n=1 Tax=Maribacter sp. IgM3_T14_3 TaxID=3415140 RepID=UPI003C6FFC50
MKANTISGNIEIKRNRGKLDTISVVMPVWDKTIEDGFLSVNIPLFAISTFAKDESDIDQAVREAITLFCINAEKFGNGLETELRVLGWNHGDTKKGITTLSFEVSQRNQVFGQVMQTGEQFAEKLDIAC